MGISTHILDTALGSPAAGVSVILWREEVSAWTTLHTASTDSEGRVKELLPKDLPLIAGIYRVHFDTAAYYKAQHVTGLYPYVEITFIVADTDRHLHIPLLLTAHGYTTYRGS